VRALCRRHETGGADGDGWDEEIKGGLTELSAEHLAAQMGCPATPAWVTSWSTIDGTGASPSSTAAAT
jgi:hypothetical protein